MKIVEIVTKEQRAHALTLLNEGFPQAGFDWSIAFESPPGKFGHGLLLMIDDEPQGELLCFEKWETIKGQRRRIVNVSSWYVRPKYRRFLIWMVRHLTQDSETIFTACTPSRAVSSIAEKLGFRYVSAGSIASIPFLNGLSKRGSELVKPYDESLFDSETQKWVGDHADEQTIPLMIQSGDRVTPLILVKGLELFQLPAARLLFTRDFELLKKALPELHQVLFRKFGIVGIYLPRIPALNDIRSLRPPDKGPSIIAKGDIQDDEVNLLYSELHHFPVSRRPLSRKVKRAAGRFFTPAG